jgi:cobalamin synthase
MNDAHLHLLLNHLPIIGLLIGTLILLVGILLKSSVSKKIALTVILFASISAIPTFSFGEGAEEVVEHMEGVTKETHHLIHEHEEKAELFMPFVWILIALSLIAIILEWKKNKIAKFVQIATLIVALTATYIAREVGTTGGEISHPEIRKDFKMEEHEDYD